MVRLWCTVRTVDEKGGHGTGRAINEKGEVFETVELEVIDCPDSQTLEFYLSDGSTAVVRFTIKRAARAIHDYSPLGEPLYLVEFAIDRRVKDIPQEFCVSPEKAKARQASKRGGPEVA